MSANSGVTEALLAHKNGDPQAGAQLVGLVYDKLRALAARQLRQERPDHTLQPTALVHEAYLRLIGNDEVDWKGKTHFLAVAAIEMRRVLTDYARSRLAKKRGGGLNRVTFDDAVAITPGGSLDMLALDEALTRLASHSKRQSQVVELRFFAGLSIKESATVLGVSEGTIKGDWRVAQAWLARELNR